MQDRGRQQCLAGQAQATEKAEGFSSIPGCSGPGPRANGPWPHYQLSTRMNTVRAAHLSIPSKAKTPSSAGGLPQYQNTKRQ